MDRKLNFTEETKVRDNYNNLERAFEMKQLILRLHAPITQLYEAYNSCIQEIQ